MTQPGLLRDRYEALGVAGEGGQGSVLRALDHQHDRLVALKVRPAGAHVDRAKLLAEARVLLGLRPHPNLPLVRDDFFHGDQYVIVMDWIEGLDLAQILADRGDPGLPLDTVIGYLEPVADALDHLHAHHPPIVHGDVKPANMIHKPGGIVQLVDFGVSDVAGAGGGSGSHGFRAPEVAAGYAASVASDIYGFAATACALLTGRAPTEGRPSWEGLAPIVAGGVERAIARGLSVEPARRPGSARELLDRLRSAREPQLPNGVVTFLLTDIESSSALWETDSSAMSEAVARHEALIADAVEEHGGVLVKSRGEGDSTMSVYPRATDAVEAAIAMQRAVATEAWPGDLELLVRVALHTGQAEVRRGDYFGQTLNRAARIRSLASGGEIVMSQATAQVVADALPEGAELVDRGEHELRGLSRPERVFELTYTGQASSTKGVGDEDREATAPTHAGLVALPLPRTSFVGREREARELLALLSESRLVTLTGLGGTGKTRLALEAAMRDATSYPDGVFFVDLAPITDPSSVLTTLASAVNAQGDVSEPQTMVLTYLSGRKALIVLDNCEHVIHSCADIVDRVLNVCPSISVLATSREALQIDGEQIFRVPALDASDEASDAVELFAARARSVKADFRLDEHNVADVVTICQSLDGIPLAIELAASRVDQIGVPDIARRLDDRFKLLAGGGRLRARRQQTLQAAMDWSWELLTVPEREVIRRLSVFAGTFTLEAAEGVCGSETVELLPELVSKSLVGFVGESPETQYRLLDTVRIYASERLVDVGEADAVRDAHRDWYLAWSEGFAAEDYVDTRAVNRFTREYANIRAAIDRSAEQDRTELFGRQILAVAHSWAFQPAFMDETKRALLKLVADERFTVATRADAFALLAFLSMHIGDLASIRPYATRSLELDQSDRRFYPMALMLSGRLRKAADAARRLGQPAFARLCRVWEIDAGIIADPSAALHALRQVALELDPTTTSWDGVFVYIGIVVAKLMLGDTTVIDDINSVRPAFEQFDVSSLGRLPYADVVEALALAQVGRFEDARLVLDPAAREILRSRYPLAANDCLLAFAYIASREGDPLKAATLLEPISDDGRMRLLPMMQFALWLLNEVNRELGGRGVDSPLPDLATMAARMSELTSGAWTPGSSAPAAILETLEREVALPVRDAAPETK